MDTCACCKALACECTSQAGCWHRRYELSTSKWRVGNCSLALQDVGSANLQALEPGRVRLLALNPFCDQASLTLKAGKTEQLVACTDALWAYEPVYRFLRACQLCGCASMSLRRWGQTGIRSASTQYFGLVGPTEQPRCIKSALWGASRSFTAPERLLVIATAPTVSAAAKAAKARVRPLLTARASSSDRRRRSADFALCKLRSICATRFAFPLRDCISQTHAVLCLRSRTLGHDHNSGAVA